MKDNLTILEKKELIFNERVNNFQKEKDLFKIEKEKLESRIVEIEKQEKNIEIEKKKLKQRETDLDFLIKRNNLENFNKI